MSEMNFAEVAKEQSKYSYTENGDVVRNTSDNSLVDLFTLAGSARDMDKDKLRKLWRLAYIESPELAMKLLFFIRDIEEGYGERATARELLHDIAERHPESLIPNIKYIPMYGRYDDWFVLFDTPCQQEMIKCLDEQLNKDLEALSLGGVDNVSNLGKWLPSESTASAEKKVLASKLRKALHMSYKQYREMCVKLRKAINIVETEMCEKRYSEIEYDKLPSRAMFVHSNAFARNDTDRYTEYIKQSIDSGKMNMKNVTPMEIVRKVLREKSTIVNGLICDAMWKNLPNYFEGMEDRKVIVMSDVSGSMTMYGGNPIFASLALGIYTAERLEEPYKNLVLTFSSNPKFHTIKGETITDKVRNLSMADWGGSTNIDKALDLILELAVKNNLRQEDMPDSLVIVSDMQFDEANGQGYFKQNTLVDHDTFYERAKQKYADVGYKIPSIVFWNVAGEEESFQTTSDVKGVQMASSYSAKIFRLVLGSDETMQDLKNIGVKAESMKDVSSYELMLSKLMSERYSNITCE